MTETGAFLHGWFDRLAESGWTAEVFLAALSDDLVWTATGSSPISGTYRGLQAYTDGIYRRLDERLESWPRPTVERIIADGDWGLSSSAPPMAAARTGSTTTCVTAGSSTSKASSSPR